MIRINKEYLDLFTKTKTQYLYRVNRGIYLAFDIDTLEYLDVEFFYLPFEYSSYQKDSEDVLNRLLSKGILELINE